MAQSAPAQRTIDPAQVGARLRATQQAVRLERQTQSRASIPSGRVLPFDPAKRRARLVAASSESENTPVNVESFNRQIAEEALYGESASPEQKAMAEMNNRRQWEADRARERQRSRSTTLPAVIEETLDRQPGLRSDPEVQEAAQVYQKQSQSLRGQIVERAVNDVVANRLKQELNQAGEKFLETVKNSELAKLAKEKTASWIWSGVSDGSIVEIEGAAGWTWYIFGQIIILYRGAKLIVAGPKSNFFKGFLGFLEPSAMNPKDPIFAFDAASFVEAFIVGSILFLIVTALIIILGAFAASILGAGSLFGSIGSFFSSHP